MKPSHRRAGKALTAPSGLAELDRVNSALLLRLSGLAFLVAFPVLLVGFLLHPRGETLPSLLTPTQGVSHAIILLAFMLAVLGLPGLYARQASRAGLLGLASFILVMFGMAYHLYLLLFEAVPAVALARDPATATAIATGGTVAHGTPLLATLFMPVFIGFTLLGIATLRAGVYPKWTGWALIAWVPLILLWPLIGQLLPGLDDFLWATRFARSTQLSYIVLFSGWAAAGWMLWRTRSDVQGERLGSLAPQGTGFPP